MAAHRASASSHALVSARASLWCLASRGLCFAERTCLISLAGRGKLRGPPRAFVARPWGSAHPVDATGALGALGLTKMPSTLATGKAGGVMSYTSRGVSPPAGGSVYSSQPAGSLAKARRLELPVIATGRPGAQLGTICCAEARVLGPSWSGVATQIIWRTDRLESRASFSVQQARPHPGARPPRTVCLLVAACEVFQIGPNASE